MVPWFTANLAEFLKQRVCRFLINRYLGQFFEEKLSAKQIELDLYNGRGSVSDVRLCCEAINSIFEDQSWGVEVISGVIELVSISIPWSSLMSEDSTVEVHGLKLCLRPKQRPKVDDTTMLETMWDSMSSSMQLAQEAFQKGDDAATIENSIDAVESFAQTIDNVFNRIKANLTNTEVRYEFVPEGSDIGFALVVKVARIEYQNESSNENPEKDDEEKGDEKKILLSTHANHRIKIQDITFYTEEFRIGAPKADRSRHTSTRSDDLDTTLNSTYMSALSSISAENDSSFYNESGSVKNENEESDSCDETDDEAECIHRSEMALFGKLNSLDVRLNLLLADKLDGPKVSLNLSAGGLFAFLTPRQMHTLLLLCDTLVNEPAAGCDNEMLKEMSPPRPSHVEEEKRRFGGLMAQQNWGGGNDFDCNSEYNSAHTMNKLRPLEADSVFSSNSSSMTSSMASSASQNTSRRRRAIERDQNADISHFNVRIAGVYVVILHDDLLVAATSRLHEAPLNEASVEKLRYKSDYFFRTVSENIASCGTSDLAKIGDILKQACDNNHLRLMLAPIIVDGEERRTTNGNCTKLNIAITRADIHEILGDLTLPILEFRRLDSTTMIPEHPEIEIAMEKTFYVVKSSIGRQYNAPRLSLGIKLGSAKLDFDITIFDRLNALFSSPFSQFYSEGPTEVDYINELTPSSQKTVQSKSKLKVSSGDFTLVLRFPIVDLRPLHDPDKRPWWQRHVRPDTVHFKFSNFQLNFIAPSVYDIMADEISILYQESEKTTPFPIAKALQFENPSKDFYTKWIDYPRIVIQFPTDAQLEELNENFIQEENEDHDSSGEGIKIDVIQGRESTPFAKKKVFRESETPHEDKNEGPEVLLIPGDREEINNFCDKAMKFSRIQIKVDFPVVSLQLKSKHLFEVIYNRIISDILMWESSVPKPKPPEPAVTLKKPPDSLLNAGMMDSIYAPFSMCKSNIHFESGSSATNSESEGESEGAFYKKKVPQVYKKDYSNAVSFELRVGQGLVTIYAPVRNSKNHVIPGQLSEFALKVNNVTIFSVSSYHGNKNLGYVCIQAGNLDLYHCGLIPVPSQNPPLREINSLLPDWLKSTIYATPEFSTLSDSRGSKNREMLSLAMQIKANPDLMLKRIKLTVGVQLATLKHNTTIPEHFWATQLQEMFDVKDDIVPGYKPYTNITEVHLHLWDCAIDYRPRHFPFRAVATVGTFMISSNLATESSGCTVRFFAEDVQLSLAPQKISDEIDDNKVEVLPRYELVCVVDLGLFEISLMINDKVTTLLSKIDLRASIKDFNIRTCSDSGKALVELLCYLCSEGDLVKAEEIEDEEQSLASSMSQSVEPEDELLQMKISERSVPEVTQSQQQHVNTLMADAMVESIYIPSTSNSDPIEQDEIVDLGTDVFFFPDEQNKREVFFSGARRKPEGQKRRCASEDSISIDSASYRDDDVVFAPRPMDEDNASINTEMRDFFDFESSVMLSLNKAPEDFDPLPQVEMDLGDISRYDTPPRRQQPPPRQVSSDSDDDFCIVADEERPTYRDIPAVQSDEPLRIIDNHFQAPHGKPDLLKAPANFPKAINRYTLCELTAHWHMYGGHDFSNQDDKKKEKEEREKTRTSHSSNRAMSDAYKMGVSYAAGASSVYFSGSSANTAANQNKLNWKTRGGSGRKHDLLIEFYLNKVRFSHEEYPQTTKQASRQVLLISEVEIRDKLEISNINKFLYLPSTGMKARQNNQIVIKSLFIRPEAALKRVECNLWISVLPIRLNIDQDTLLFMIDYFSDVGGSAEPGKSSPAAVKPYSPPVMMVEMPEGEEKEYQARKLVEDNLTLLLDGEQQAEPKKEQPEEQNEAPCEDASAPIYFRQIVFSPEVQIRVDYVGKRVVLSHGPLAGLLMGLGQLQFSEITLKKISYRHGILGVDKLIQFLVQEWLRDIKKRQLPKILGGVGPMYSLVQLFQGFYDLFWLPIEQYQIDGRIVRGIQRGAQSFSSRTCLALLELTSRVIYLVQITAEVAYDMLSPAGPSLRRRINRKGKRKRLHPPQDIRQGMNNAYLIVKDGIGDTATTICEMAALEHDQKGYTGAVGAVIRQIPPTIVRPLVLATQASSNLIGGLKNELIPNARIESKEKWKEDENN